MLGADPFPFWGEVMNGFEDAFTILMDNEGGYVDNPKDPGGATRYGVTERVARLHGYKGDMRQFPLDLAKTIAKLEYWDKFMCDQFDPRIGFHVFDTAYNGGHPAKWLQKACGAVQDGDIGAKTIAAVRRTDPLKIIILFNAERIQYLTDLNVWDHFSEGWMKRLANNMRRGIE